jgi:hypothetical protein
MKNKRLFTGLVCLLALILWNSCSKKVCAESLGEVPANETPEVRDTMLQDRRVYFAGERKLFNPKDQNVTQPMRRVIFRNVAQLPFTEKGIIKLYTEINEAAISSKSTLKKAVNAALGYKYEPMYGVPVQAGVLTISLNMPR